MKRKHIAAICIAVAVLAGLAALAIVAQADSGDLAVVLDAAARQFKFLNVTPCAGNTYPNLFADAAFSAMMPGDTAGETIMVSAENLNGGYADIFLSAEARSSDISAEEARAFELLMQNATITIRRTDANGAATSVGLPADGRVQLGTFHEGDSVTITVDLGINKEAGNDLQDLHAEIGWVFQAEIYESDTPSGGGGTGGGSGGGSIGGGDEGDEGEPGEPMLPQLNKDDHFAYIIGRKDGLVHPEANITRGEVAAIFFRLLTDESRAYYWSESNPYPDVLEDTWCNNEVSTLTNAGIIKGRKDGTFGYKDYITRGEVAVICSRFFVLDGRGRTFPDIQGHWAQEEIEFICSNGYLYGYKDGTFRPDNLITRAEFVTMVNRLLERTPDKDYLHPDMICWPDNMDTSTWYYANIQEATNSHLFTRSDVASYEVWTEVLPPPDWNALEEEWSRLYGPGSTGQTVDSRTAADYQ